MTSTKNNKQQPRWRLEDIDFREVDRALVKDDELMFYALASASFVEILAELYSDNLIEHFRGNADAVAWLQEHWQHEELQHGRALKAYVKAVWPEFEWERAHAAFVEEYGALCTAQQLETVRGLEMLARCVVETGTTTMYRALHDYAREPVLVKLFANIKADEASHYAHFRDYYEAYQQRERFGIWAVAGAIWRRIREIGSEDSYIAFKHVYAGRYPGRPFDEDAWRRYSQTVKRHARQYYPYSMAIKMTLKLVPLAQPVKNLLQRSLLGLVRLASLS
ncbi:MAG TPA: ferritin-like domain-containing protein [Janthinobacterium sp.]|jgi:rubrerythrin|nr:ferritin-like domain-containing protein [Janthinobacterium sp.]